MKEKDKKPIALSRRITAQGLTSTGLWGAMGSTMPRRKIRPEDRDLR